MIIEPLKQLDLYDIYSKIKSEVSSKASTFKRNLLKLRNRAQRKFWQFTLDTDDKELSELVQNYSDKTSHIENNNKCHLPFLIELALKREKNNDWNSALEVWLRILGITEAYGEKAEIKKIGSYVNRACTFRPNENNPLFYLYDFEDKLIVKYRFYDRMNDDIYKLERERRLLDYLNDQSKIKGIFGRMIHSAKLGWDFRVLTEKYGISGGHYSIIRASKGRTLAEILEEQKDSNDKSKEKMNLLEGAIRSLVMLQSIYDRTDFLRFYCKDAAELIEGIPQKYSIKKYSIGSFEPPKGEEKCRNCTREDCRGEFQFIDLHNGDNQFNAEKIQNQPYTEEMNYAKLFLDKIVRRIGLFKQISQEEYAPIFRNLRSISNRLSSLEETFCHSDFHHGNLINIEERVSDQTNDKYACIIDFEKFCLANPFYDIAYLLEQSGLGLSREDKEELVGFYTELKKKDGKTYDDPMMLYDYNAVIVNLKLAGTCEKWSEKGQSLIERRNLYMSQANSALERLMLKDSSLVPFPQCFKDYYQGKKQTEAYVSDQTDYPIFKSHMTTEQLEYIADSREASLDVEISTDLKNAKVIYSAQD